MILDDAIIELFDQGIYDPAQIEQMLAQRGKRWLSEALIERSSRLIREHVRELAQKRTVLVPPAAAPRPASEPHTPVKEVYGELVWVIGEGYKPIALCSSDDLRMAAAYLRGKAVELAAKADDYDAAAAEMDAAGVKIYADLGVAA